MKPIFVTGAQGNVGRYVVELLHYAGANTRIAVRALKEADRSGDGERVHFDFLDFTTYAPAVAGCRVIFLLRPPAISNTKATLNRLLDVAQAAGVTQAVFLSVDGAASNPLLPHHAVERHLKERWSSWTILRPGFFAQNLASAYHDDIRFDDRLFVPSGSGRVAFVDTRDVAEVAVQALLDPSAHARQAYTLTGPAAVSFTQVAGLLSHELGRTIRYEPASPLAYIAHLIRAGLPLTQTLIQTVLHVGLRFGQAEEIDDTLERLLGHSPRTIAEYIHDHRSLWLK